MVEGVAVTPDSKFAHASLLTRARPKIGIEQACVSPGQDGDRQAYALKAIALFAESSVRVSDGGGSPPAFTVAMLALTPDAVDVHPFSVALLDVARVAAGLGHFSGASGAACDAMLVDVTVRRVHKNQYITAAPLPALFLTLRSGTADRGSVEGPPVGRRVVPGLSVGAGLMLRGLLDRLWSI